MNDCVFCKIIKGELPSSKIYEDKTLIAVMDIQPVNPGHVLVIPKSHADLIAKLNDETAAQLFVVAKKINKALRKSGLKADGVNYFLADGEAAGQEVSHVHLHVFPRFQGDGFGLKFSDQYFKLPKRSELEETAEKIRLAM